MLDHVETAVGLFPGQGGYRRGALASFRENRETAVLDAFAAVDAAAKAVLGKQVSDRAFTADPPSPEDLFALDPDVLQLAVFAVSVGTFGALRARGARLDVLMGHSMGEVAALVCADAFTVDDGAELLCHRIAATTAAAGPSGGMVSLGCAEERAQDMVDLIDGDLVIAAVNGPEQVVVSGRPTDLRSLEGVAAAVGVTASRLLAPHAFHSPWMSQARVEVRRRIHGYRQRPLRSPVFSPINGRLYRDGDNLLDQLSLHLVAPVRFGPAVARLYDAGARIFVEVGAGSALTGLVRSAFPAATTLAPVAGGDEERTLTAATAFLAPPGLQDRRSCAETVPPATVSAQDQRSTPSDDPSLAVRAVFAAALEYPEEVFTPEAHLEADLGIDSVKRTELLARLRDRFHLGPLPDRTGPADYPTFGSVVDLVRATRGRARSDAR